MGLSRRQFLRASAAGAASAAVPGLTDAQNLLQPVIGTPEPEPQAENATAKATRDSIRNVWGDRTPYYQQWPGRVDARILEQPERWIQSTCILCSSGCGMDVGVKDGKIVAVRGREVDRVNHGRLGPKGLYGWEANNSPDRLRKPLIRTSDGFKRPGTKQ